MHGENAIDFTLGVFILSNLGPTRQAIAEALLKRASETPQDFFDKLDAENDELTVRETLAAGRYRSRSGLAIEWLRRREEARIAEATARAEAREAESLSIANKALAAATEANRIASEDVAAARESAASAREQARWAMWAAIIATVAAIVAMFKG